MTFSPNDGSRPSRLELAQRYSGERPEEGGPEEAAYRREVEARAGGLPAFDWAILRAAAGRVPAPDPLLEPPRP